MTSGVGPYVLPSPSDTAASATVLETVIFAEMVPSVDIGIGRVANLETYNGAIPGPLLSLNVNDTVIVRLINKLDHPTGIHWHGIELSNSADGTEVTQEGVIPAFTTPPPPPVPPGGTYLYKFKVTRPGIFWYHPHHHHSTNRVFRGLYGMIVVKDPNEAALIANNTIPGPADTKQLVLSDITVCKAAPGNDTATYPASAGAEWVGGNASQPGPTPKQLCEIAPAGTATKDDGSAGTANWAAGDVPSIVRGPGRVNEGQTVLTNGFNVGDRPGSPDAPGALPPAAHRIGVLAGQGLRLQIANCSAIRYFRLVLMADGNVPVPLVRIGGEGGLLDQAVVEGGIVAGFDWKYDSGEILVPPGCRVDVVAAIPDTLANTSTLTLWTRDFPRQGGAGFADLPTVPVMHLEVTGNVAPQQPYTIAAGTLLRAAAGNTPIVPLGAAAGMLLTPAGFMPSKPGSMNPTIELTTVANGPTGIDGVMGNFEGATPYGAANHLASSRYAQLGDTLELQVFNSSNAHHPFHLHGFSFQPISLTRTGDVPYIWPYAEFRDNVDIPSNYTLTFRVRIDDRELVDGVTSGGGLGRWLFHCHIFFHHHHGMIGELVVCAPDGKEKPNVDVNGSWVYVPLNAPAQRRGTFYSPMGAPVTLSVSPAIGTVTATVTSPGVGTWEWNYDTTGVPAGTQYVYITGEGPPGLKDQAVFRLKIGPPDDGGDNGDPHIRTVDGTYYDFQAAGEFTLLCDSESLEIQVRQTPVPSAPPVADGHSGLTACVSVNTAIAARIGDRRIAFQPLCQAGGRLQFFLDGKPSELTERGFDFDAGRVSAFPAGGGATGLRIDYANYTTLTVTPWFWNSYNIWILNISVSHTDADLGIMGRIPKNSWLPMLPRGGNVGPRPASLNDRYTALYRTFADAWRVTDATSLFVYQPGTSTKTFTDRGWPPARGRCNVKPEFQIPGANPPLVNIKPATAERLCKPVRIDDLHRGCVFDVATTGDKEWVKAYLLAQEVRLTGTSVQIVADRPKSQPGEAVLFTATVSPFQSGGPPPRGSISFLVDDVPSEKPIDVDERGRASLKTGSLGSGLRRVSAVFTSADQDGGYRGSSSASLRHSVERKPPADRTQAPYNLSGLFYEACDCFVVCPCWLGGDPDEGACTGVFAWEIKQGSIDGVDVSGLMAVSVSQHTGSREEARQRVVIFVDERATRRQAALMAAAFSGRFGGPLKELAELLGELLAVERASISIRREGRFTTLTVGHRIRVEGTTNQGPSGRHTELNEGRLSKVLGSPAQVGQSGRFRVGLGDHDMDLDLRGRSTMSGRFSYVHRPKAGAPSQPGHDRRGM